MSWQETQERRSPSHCPICGEPRAWYAGMRTHMQTFHGLWAGGRAMALALDVVKAEIRGWPIDPPRERLASELASLGYSVFVRR